jgi:hypothetical protein
MKRWYYTSISLFLLVIAVIPAYTQEAEEKSSNDEGFVTWINTEVQEFVKNVRSQIVISNGKIASHEYTNVSDEEDTTETDISAIDSTYEGSTTVKKDEIVSHSLCIKDGTLTVYGTVKGDVLVIGGNLIVKSGGHITGNAKVVGGELIRDDGGIVDGYMEISKKQNTNGTQKASVKNHSFGKYLNRLPPWLTGENAPDKFLFRYNRVEGLFLGFELDKKYRWTGERDYSMYGSLGYGFSSHLWKGKFGLSKQFVFYDEESKISDIVDFGAEGYSIVDTKDAWLINLHENTAAAFFFHEDWRDYFQREGGTAYIGFLRHDNYFTSQFQVAYLYDDYRSISKMTDWAMFGGEKTFRDNDSIAAGRMRSLRLTFGIHTVTRTYNSMDGWNIFTLAEFGNKFTGSDFDFNQYSFEVARYQPLSNNDNFNVRLKAASTEYNAPVQKAFDLGGVGTLPAYSYKFKKGNRMLLANTELILGSGFFGDQDFFLTDILNEFTYIISSNTGWIGSAAPTAAWHKGFSKITWSDVYNDIGVGIGNSTGSFRMMYSQRTTEKADGVWFIRISRPF